MEHKKIGKKCIAGRHQASLTLIFCSTIFAAAPQRTERLEEDNSKAISSFNNTKSGK